VINDPSIVVHLSDVVIGEPGIEEQDEDYQCYCRQQSSIQVFHCTSFSSETWRTNALRVFFA